MVRLSGPDAHTDRAATDGTRQGLFARGTRRWPTSSSRAGPCARRESLDRAIVTFFAAPRSFTGEDVVEISAHGSPVLLRRIVELAMAAGARLGRARRVHAARPPQRPIGPVQAEAIADLVDAVTPLQARAAMDQLEGTLTTAIRRHRRADVRPRGAARGVARFSGRRAFISSRASRPPASCASCRRRSRRSIRDGRAGRVVRDGSLVVISGRPNAGQIEPVQRARRRRARNRHRGARDDARSADRAGGRRRIARSHWSIRRDSARPPTRSRSRACAARARRRRSRR